MIDADSGDGTESISSIRLRKLHISILGVAVCVGVAVTNARAATIQYVARGDRRVGPETCGCIVVVAVLGVQGRYWAVSMFSVATVYSCSAAVHHCPVKMYLQHVDRSI